MSKKNILGDSWYAEALPELCVSFNSLIARQRFSWVVSRLVRYGFFRGFMLFIYGRRYERVITTLRHKGTIAFLFLQNLFGGAKKKKVYILEFTPVSRKQVLHLQSFKFRIKTSIIEFALILSCKRTILRAHVLASQEIELYKKRFSMDREVFMFIPWPLLNTTDVVKPNSHFPGYNVLCSGRFYCDWETIFLASNEANWNLQVVCGRHDEMKVKMLVQRYGGTWKSDISDEEHATLLKSASVYVICLNESEVSSGQIRVANAMSFGIPIVATKVIGIEDYLIDGQTAILVPPNNVKAMHSAIDYLINNRYYAQKLASQAFEYAKIFTKSNYLNSISNFITIL